LVRFIKHKKTTVLMAVYHAGGDISNEGFTDDSAGPEGSFPDGIALGKLLFPQ